VVIYIGKDYRGSESIEYLEILLLCHCYIAIEDLLRELTSLSKQRMDC
jgi:hypothetical protein